MLEVVLSNDGEMRNEDNDMSEYELHLSCPAYVIDQPRGKRAYFVCEQLFRKI